MSDLTPREIVAELDRYIVGQGDAKRAVAVALRGRWRRRRLSEALRREVMPKNILMVGPTGVGKTEIARRLARLAAAPFLKVEATKFTEVGYVGRDVDQIVRDLVEISIALVRAHRRHAVRAGAEARAEERVLDALVGAGASPATREAFRRKLRAGELHDKEIELTLAEPAPGAPGAAGLDPAQTGGVDLTAVMSQMSGLFGGGARARQATVKVKDAPALLMAEEADKMTDQAEVVREAIALAEEEGIVFIDEIDKVARGAGFRGGAGGEVSREGVQRDLLPLIEGTTVSTRHGPVRSDHMLFICSGAFHVSRPSDLLPELQGRLPIRVELQPLTRADFRRILVEPEANLIRQQAALMQTEGLALAFTDDGLDAVADAAAAANARVEDIGARRLQTVLEAVLEDASFGAGEREGETLTLDGAYVRARTAALLKRSSPRGPFASFWAEIRRAAAKLGHRLALFGRESAR